MSSELTALVTLGLVAALVAWGVWPKSEAKKSAPPPPPATADREAESLKVGVVVGTMGGSIEDAAVVRYALSRQDHPATPYEIGLAAGLERTLRQDGEAER